MPTTLKTVRRTHWKENNIFEDISSLIGRVYKKLLVSSGIVHNSRVKSHRSKNKRHRK